MARRPGILPTEIPGLSPPILFAPVAGAAAVAWCR